MALKSPLLFQRAAFTDARSLGTPSRCSSLLERVLVEPFRENYGELVETARARLDPEDLARQSLRD